MDFEKLEKKTLRQQVYEQLKEKMITAEILPGQQISLRDLAGKLGVSLMPVREALWQLEAERAVVIESNKKMVVNSLSPQDVDEILWIRLAVEIMAVQRACELRDVSALSEVERLLTEMGDSVGVPEDYLKANRMFHFTLYSLARSPILVDIISRLWTRVGPYIYLVAWDQRGVRTAMTFHERMYKALVKRDQDMMSEALRSDLVTAAEGMKDWLERVGPDPEKIIQFLSREAGRAGRRG